MLYCFCNFHLKHFTWQLSARSAPTIIHRPRGKWSCFFVFFFLTLCRYINFNIATMLFHSSSKLQSYCEVRLSVIELWGRPSLLRMFSLSVSAQWKCTSGADKVKTPHGILYTQFLKLSFHPNTRLESFKRKFHFLASQKKVTVNHSKFRSFVRLSLLVGTKEIERFHSVGVRVQCCCCCDIVPTRRHRPALEIHHKLAWP